MILKIINKSHHPLPKYETQYSAGLDLKAFLPEGPITLEPLQRGLVKTGLSSNCLWVTKLKCVLAADWHSRKASPFLIRRVQSMQITEERFV